jgi:hypothetical protein
MTNSHFHQEGEMSLYGSVGIEASPECYQIAKERLSQVG